MAFQWTSVNSTNYNKDLFDFIRHMEELKTRDYFAKTAYIDGKGHPTIGAGFNLDDSSVRKNVILRIFYPSQNRADYDNADLKYVDDITKAISTYRSDASALNTELNRIMVLRNKSNPASRTSFSFDKLEEGQSVFESLMPAYNDEITKWAKGNPLIGIIPNSKERMVLFSLAYNTVTGQTSLLGKNLRDAIAIGNRAEAWYEIRYGSNLSGEGGVAKRRYYESQQFGLYNSGTLSDAEARQVFQMITRHWNEKIEKYDATHSAQVAKANGDYNTTIVQTTEEATGSTKELLVNAYGLGKQIDKIWVDWANITTGIENNSLDFSARKDNGLFFGGAGNDTISAGSGNDIIYGEVGNDTLYGGAGNDILLGGTGNDTFNLGTAANDGNDTVYITTQNGAAQTVKVNNYNAGDNLYIDNTIYKTGQVDPQGTYYMNGNKVEALADGIIISLPDGSKIYVTAARSEDDKNIYYGGTGGIVLHKTDKNGNTHNVSDFTTTISSEYDSALLLQVATPLVLDLNGDGIKLTSLSGPGSKPVYFDMDNDGFAEATAWVHSADGLLALDRNKNGKIDQQNEFFGFDSLRALDSNRDNRITAADADYNKLRVWRDFNQDGISQNGELIALAALRIMSISLADKIVKYDIAGNLIVAESTFIIDGKTRKIADAAFNVDNVNSIYQGNYTISPQIAALPQFRGYGNLPDLRIAMSLNAKLLAKVQEFTKLDIAQDAAKISDIVKQIMHLWAGVENIDPSGRGNDSRPDWDARDISFVEKYFDKIASEEPGGTVGNLRGPAIQAIFNQIKNRITAALATQSVGFRYFTKLPNYNATLDTYTGPYQINFDYMKTATAGKPLATIIQQWSALFDLIDGIYGIESIDATTRAKLTTAIAASDSGGRLNFDIISQIFNQTIDKIISGSATAGSKLNGTVYNDLILGGKGDDTFSTNNGNDIMFGGAGNDVFSTDSYTFSTFTHHKIDGGDGIDTIQSFGANLINADITGIEKIDIYNEVKLTASQFRNINEYGVDPESGYSGPVQITGADAGTYNLAPKRTNIGVNFTGSDGDDIIYAGTNFLFISGGNGKDIINGSNGNDRLSGGSDIDKIYGNDGDDIIAVDYNESGADEVIDGGAGDDSIEASSADLSKAIISNIEKLIINGDVKINKTQFTTWNNFISAINNYAVNLRMSDAGNYDLNNKNISGNINFYGSTGSDILTASTKFKLVDGGDGNDIINGSAGNDTIAGGAGADKLYGAAGDDTLILRAADTEAGEIIDGGNGIDTVQVYDADLSLAKIVSVEKMDIFGAAILTAAQLPLFPQFSGKNDDSRLSAAAAGTYDLSKLNVTGTLGFIGSVGNDIITGNSKFVSIDGGYGNDTINGTAGNDILKGGDGSDIITGADGNDTLSGGTGADQLNGGNGNDIFVVNYSEAIAGETLDGGAGIDIIASYNADISVLKWSNIEQFDVYGSMVLSATQMTAMTQRVVGKYEYSNTLEAKTAGTYDLSKLDVTGAFDLRGSAGNDILIGNDASQSISSNGGDDIMRGLGGNDRLGSGSGNDTLDGGTGDDYLYGNKGNDTYILGRTYGHDQISDYDSTAGNKDMISVLSGVARDQLWFTQNGNNLIMQIIGTGDKTTINGWFESTANQIETIKTATGNILVNSKVQNLVNAMASLAVPLTTTLSQDYHNKLDTIIAANWT